MNIPAIFDGLHYCGVAEGDRRVYYVFQSKVGYLVLTPSSTGSFNLNIVDADAPELIVRRFKGKELTVNRLERSGRRPDLFSHSFACLNALYVMVALGRARKLKKREGKAMVFKIR